jgi:hypothetical protein
LLDPCATEVGALPADVAYAQAKLVTKTIARRGTTRDKREKKRTWKGMRETSMEGRRTKIRRDAPRCGVAAFYPTRCAHPMRVA